MNSENNCDIVNKKVLNRSVIFTIAYTVMALAVGFLTSSQVILFDGIFNLTGVALTYLSIFAMKFINKYDSWNYPFGKITFEPFIAITQYFIILYICVTTVINAVQIIIDGGHVVNVTSGILYGIIATIFNIAVYFYLKFLTKKHLTPIARVEIDQWKFSCLLSIGILIGFSISWILQQTALAEYSSYADPALTILITVAFGKTAILDIKSCVRELLMGKPSDEIVEAINQKLNVVNSNYQLSDHVLRLGKVGGKLIIEIGYIIEKDSKMDSIQMQDNLRKELARQFAEIEYEKWINVTFTSDVKWVKLY